MNLCVLERRHLIQFIRPNSRRTQPEATEIWHVVDGTPDDKFAPILCHETEGIVLPGHPVERDPTCPDCIKLVRDLKRL